MTIIIASEPSCEFSLIIYSGGESLTPTHPRPISRVVAKQRASAAITRRAPPPAARPSPWRSRSSSRWPCAVPACWLFAPCMYMGRRIRQPRHMGDGAPPGAPVRSLRVLPSHSPRGPSPTVAAHGPWNRQLVRNSAHLDGSRSPWRCPWSDFRYIGRRSHRPPVPRAGCTSIRTTTRVVSDSSLWAR